MATRYSQNFTLKDIFGNKRLKDKLPMIIDQDSTKSAKKGQIETAKEQIFSIAKIAASPFYNPINIKNAGNTIIIDGDLVGSLDDVVEAIYSSLVEKKSMFEWTAFNNNIINSAIKETEQNKRYNGIGSKLFLRVQSMQEIAGMSKQQIRWLMNDIIDNIVYGDDFPQTQKKFNVENMLTDNTLNYRQRQLRWKYKVGDI